MYVTKRDGRREPLDLDKFHKMVEEACDELAGVSASQVEMNSNIQFYDGITTRDIQQILVRSASDLISLDYPNYQYVAARLLLFGLRKDVYGQFKPLPLREMVKKNAKLGVYDSELLNWFSKEEFDELEQMIKWDRDMLFTFAGLQQLVDKYLVQDRSNGQIFETPQIAYILIAATLFHSYDKNIRMDYIKRYYDAISLFKINLPTPIMAGVRTPKRQYASCVLVDVDDTLDSIFSSNTAIGKYTASRAGIGINIGRLRGINAKIRGGEVIHTGLIPFLKMYAATVRSCSQNGLRGGNLTCHVQIWHKEIEDVIVLKNNKGTEDNRIRTIDYSIQISKLFYERYLQDGMITLFSTNDVPGLYDVWGMPEFDQLYTKYENDKTIPKKSISARELFHNLMKERAETGRIYIMNIDHHNDHGAFLEQVAMSNLCQEISLVTKPIQTVEDISGRVATCILSAVNMGKVPVEDLEDVCDLVVRGLDALIDFQDYPILAAELYTKEYRTLGVGYVGMAHYLAKNKAKYNDPAAWKLVHEYTEAFQYHLLKASVSLAKEHGAAPAFAKTKYAQGKLPIDTYKKDVDQVVPNLLKMDWEGLRSDILTYGLRNCTVTAQMPSESSSVISNATNGIEPPRELMSVKKSKKGALKIIVPGFYNLKNNYTLLWDLPNMDGYMNVVAVMQKFFDQSISANTAYNIEKYADGQVPMSTMMRDVLIGYKLGLKNFYYQNTNDGKKEIEIKPKEEIVVLPIDEEIDIESEDCESCAI